MGEEPAGDDADHGIGRDGGQHADSPADMTGDENDDENLQRGGLDAGRVDKRLIDKVIHKLGGEHDEQDDQREHPDVYVQPDAGAVLEHHAEHHAQQFPDQRADVGDDVQKAR